MSTTTTAPTSAGLDFKVADLSLAEFGRKEIRLAEHEMPGLMSTRAEFADSKPLTGARVILELHPLAVPKGGPMAKDHGSSVKNDKQYEGLRKKGMSKERAAKISNANAGSGNAASKKGGKKGGKKSGKSS